MPVIKTLILTMVGVMTIGLSGLGVDFAFGRQVTLVLDGVPKIVSVVYGSVAEVLADNNVQLQSHDRVSPEMSTVVSNGAVIDVAYARPIDLTLNGQRGIYWTYANTVEGVVKCLGLGDAALKLSSPPDTVVPRSGMELSVAVGHTVNVTADGQTQSVHSFGTVENALLALGLAWDDNDMVEPAVGTDLSDQLPITLVRVEHQTVTRDTAIPFATQNTSDPEATKGKVTVVTPGANGLLKQVVDQVVHDGAVVSQTVVSETVVTEPVTQVTTTGTKEAPLPTVNVTPGSAQDIAHTMVLERGWDEAQFSCLVNLWNRESGWRVNAANRSSGAYGIPQALPGSKMASAGADWQTNPATQITWGLGYITSRYGTPCGAWSAFQSKGWY